MTMMNRPKNLLCSVFLTLFGAVGCDQRPADSAAPDEIVMAHDQGQAFADFKKAQREIEPGIYAVDDMLLTTEQLGEHFVRAQPSGGALTVKTSSAGRKIWGNAERWDLSWCVSDDFGSNKSAVIEAMEKATAGWQTEAGTGVRFVRAADQDATCTTDNSKVRIPVIYAPTLTGAFADAWVGPSTAADGRQYNRLRVAKAALSWWDLNFGSFGSLDLKAVLAHELGHVLGFYHEHSNSQAGGCSDGSWDSNHEAVTAYDPGSIMHYVWAQDAKCTATNYRWISTLDGQGARAVYPGGTTPAPVCQNRSYGRGAGTVPNQCAAGKTMEAGLCYTPCRAGYGAAGPVCWQRCPSGYRDDGAFCRRDAHIYGNGCRGGCAAGYTNDGCTCRRNARIFAKSTYGRGAGTVPNQCGSGRQLDAGLCYTKCTAGYAGSGPVCWETCS